ncbi:NrtR DNA-binding winged helix domain-containing protein [Arundinibacter roseus]|uniref:NUDIX domain-containing protein n=1 Tax=Arundinibacter roseus TaxID=2070510 RepID=A0A4R4KC06_9BACT|nr:NUDIX domain-containing protein [Arundinibacter roseus]TDB63971.1 NUDIX domain-containing protein [Arundinibacter roseus]
MNSHFLPGISIDCVVFGFHGNQLKFLVTRIINSDLYALPGGFLHEDENLSDAAQRILFERTNLSNIYLEQFHVYGDKNRRSEETQRQILEGIRASPEAVAFLSQRFISIGYYALIDFTKAEPIADYLSASSEWRDLSDIPPLIFDHNQMVQKALETLRITLDHRDVGYNLLPPTFTMSELQALHETILGEKLVRSNFQRKMLSGGLLERIEKKMTGAAHKAPFLYRFRHDE